MFASIGALQRRSNAAATQVLLGGAAVLAAAAVGAPGCSSPVRGSTAEPAIIKLQGGAVTVLTHPRPLNSPALSADGRRLAVQVEEFHNPLLPYEIYSLAVSRQQPGGSFEPLRVVEPGITRRLAGRMTLLVSPAFDDTRQGLLVTRVRFGSLLGLPLRGSLRSSIERIDWDGGPPQREVGHEACRLPATEVLQHPRVSPDGRHLAFYTQYHREFQGIRVLDRQTGRQVQLGHDHDKHPTWSPEGKRIYFHTQTGGRQSRFDVFANVPEQARLGYFELGFAADGSLRRWTRRMMDDAGPEYVYHKHPAEVPGSGLLFFHGRLKPEGRNRLMVRAARPGSTVYVVQPDAPGAGKRRGIKHACAPAESARLMFLTKAADADHYGVVMALTDAALHEIRRRVLDGSASSAAAAFERVDTCLGLNRSMSVSTVLGRIPPAGRPRLR